MATNNFWTESRTAMLRKFHSDGLTCRFIAEQLGTSRGAIAGKIDRLGLNNGGIPRPHKPRPSQSLYKSRGNPNNINAEAINRTRLVAMKPYLRAKDPGIARLEPSAPLRCKRISIMELNDKTCRWPMGDPGQPGFSYCGLPPWPPSRYCPYHLDVSTGRKTS